jgi:hypothetical protein
MVYTLKDIVLKELTFEEREMAQLSTLQLSDSEILSRLAASPAPAAHELLRRMGLTKSSTAIQKEGG